MIHSSLSMKWCRAVQKQTNKNKKPSIVYHVGNSYTEAKMSDVRLGFPNEIKGVNYPTLKTQWEQGTQLPEALLKRSASGQNIRNLVIVPPAGQTKLCSAPLQFPLFSGTP